jgi:hypothetical protein
MIRNFHAMVLLLPATGCGLFVGSDNGAISEQAGCVRPERGTINNGPLPEGCTKTEGDDLGRMQALTAGGSTIEFTGWISKNDSGEGEFVGFTYVAPAGTFISIKAGGESHIEDGDGAWTHPAGLSGPEASAISNIVVCEGEPEVPDPGTPGGEGEGEEGGGECDPPGDSDGDGEPDPTDPDDDNDGVPDAQDPSPNGGPDPAGGGQCNADSDCQGGVCNDGVCIDV